ncbi:hypothetical protein pdam_00020013 [Pocillopora damicornis]|uniref:Uncharacterized protein n=1 Tax=Pocillopora damicornis TaxID=46731 RepID=A0A3M6UW86_POCDA|nr:hypothetical protein pdam_00020013 [Pocillopora damicornis]
MILSAIPAIQPLPPVPMAPQNIQKMKDRASLSDRKQRWQELELPVVPLLERSSAGRTRVSLECSDFEKQRKNSGKQDGEEDGILEYDSPSDNDDIQSLEREADFTSEEVPASEEVFA